MSGIRIRNISLFVAIITCLSFTAHAQKSAISIGPATLYFTVDKGQTATQTAYITNKLSKPYSFSIEVIDWTLDSNGDDRFYEPKTVQNSCAQWITLDKTFVEIPANSKEGINVTLHVPDSADAVKEIKWTMLHIGTKGEKKAPKKTGELELELTKSLAVGVRVYQVPPANVSLTKKIKMRSFTMLQDSATYRIDGENTGDMMLRCQYSIELSSETGEKITVGPKQALMLPGQKRYIDLQMPKTLPKGKYTATALIEPGDDDVPLEASEMTIEVK